MTKLLKETLNSILNEGAKIPMRVSGINKDGDMYEVRLQLDIDTSEIEAAFVDVEQIISSFDEDHDVQKGSKKGYDIPFIEGGFSRNGYYDSDIINDIANKVPEIILPESDKGEEIGIGHEQLHVNNGTIKSIYHIFHHYYTKTVLICDIWVMYVRIVKIQQLKKHY